MAAPLRSLAHGALDLLTPSQPVYVAKDAGPKKASQQGPDFRPPTRAPMPEESPFVRQLYEGVAEGRAHRDLCSSIRGLAHGVMLEPRVIDGPVYVSASTGDWGKGTREADRRQRAFVKTATDLGVHRFQILGDVIYPVAPTSLDDSRLHSQLSGIVAALGPIGADAVLLGGNHDWANLDTHAANPEGIRVLMEHAAFDPVLKYPARYWAQEVHLNGGAGPKILEVYLDNEFLHEDPRQLKWLDTLLETSDCDRIKIKMHRGFLSGGRHGKNDELETYLAPRVNACSKVVAVEAAHDHHNEEIIHPNLRAPMSISGTAGESRGYEPTPFTRFGTSRPAFRVSEEDGAGETIRWFDTRSRPIYAARYEPDAQGRVRAVWEGAENALR